MKHAKKYFDNHSTIDVLYFTSDNLAFFEEGNAMQHAANLDDPTVLPITRNEVQAAMRDMNKEGWDELPEYDALDEPDAE